MSRFCLSLASILILVTVANAGGVRRPRPPAKTTPVNTQSNDTIYYVAYFSGYSNLTSGAVLTPDDSSFNQPATTLNVEIPPNEGDVGMTISLIGGGSSLTTGIYPTLSARRKVVLETRKLDFEINLQLMSLRSGSYTNPVAIGVAMEMEISQGYFVPNSLIALQWPVEWSSLSDYADSEGRIGIRVLVRVANPNWNRRVTTTYSPFEQRPI